ncbi:hypothetical protein GQ43DRAFT_434929 [Delitschia confertaspora ATCC 74209]|uniref:Uncharacterized protein n=1 Tax=Delitschia confertaspora ATCC 74209 TaxID=1513339 RepID=A0A9P4MNZ5_9PLEO|nr:hypothetical protein GQ43DRAFT_434929 [Delitschia confertaspora ATCC 74209]
MKQSKIRSELGQLYWERSKELERRHAAESTGAAARQTARQTSPPTTRQTAIQKRSIAEVENNGSPSPLQTERVQLDKENARPDVMDLTDGLVSCKISESDKGARILGNAGRANPAEPNTTITGGGAVVDNYERDQRNQARKAREDRLEKTGLDPNHSDRQLEERLQQLKEELAIAKQDDNAAMNAYLDLEAE